MKKLMPAIVLLSAFAVPAFAQAPAPAAKASVSQTVQQLEHDWVDAVKAGDAAKLSSVLGDDWVALGYGATPGVKETKKSYVAEIGAGRVKIDSYEFGPMDVKVLGNVAVVLGSDTEKSTNAGKDSSGKYEWLDVFVLRGGNWVAVRSQSSKVK